MIIIYYTARTNFSTTHYNEMTINLQQDDMAGEIKSASILDHVPIEDTVHKENTIKPGPWSNVHKRGPLIAPSVKAGFKGRTKLNIESKFAAYLCGKIMDIFRYLSKFTKIRMMTVTWRKLNCFQIMYPSSTVADFMIL